MTTTAEEKAKAVVESLLRLPHVDEGEALTYGTELIAAAITQAQNDKLEEAARLMERVMADSKAALIRTLKTED